MAHRDELGFCFGVDGTPIQSPQITVCVPAGISTKRELLACLAAYLDFPDYFGENWDAFEECIRNFEWLEPMQIVLIHSDLPLQDDPGSLGTYLRILRDAIEHRTAKPKHDLIVIFPPEYELMVRSLLAER